MNAAPRRYTALAVSSLLAACATGGISRPPATASTAPSDFDPTLLREAGVDAARLHCNRDNRWGNLLKSDSEQAADDLLAAVGPRLVPAPEIEQAALRKKLARLVFWRMVRAVLLEGDTNNLGVFPLRGRTWVDAHGGAHPVLVFRSGITPDPGAPDSCFGSLLDAGRVRHVVNLFDGEIPVADLVAAESAAAARAGATYQTAADAPEAYGPWRDLLRSHYEEADARRHAMESVARLIRDQILLPGGAPPRGNIHLHCGGGMHRSGMIAGILERCVDGAPRGVVEAHYRYHVGWRDPAHPGGLEENNLRFLRDFDCALLGEPASK